MKFNHLTIIIADDDDDDKTLITNALVDNGIKKEHILLTSDGAELLEVLKGFETRPCLVLLDLNMPRKDGFKALAEIKSDQMIKHVPVIIFTTSNSSQDILTTYKLGSNTFFTKPNYYHELVELMGVIKSYWFEKAALLT
ncbi:MAG: response regulator [Azospira oryzae]|jgi:two-component system response regulator|nr:MAG: response regulator [Azospira oryzae]